MATSLANLTTTIERKYTHVISHVWFEHGKWKWLIHNPYQDVNHHGDAPHKSIAMAECNECALWLDHWQEQVITEGESDL